MHEFFILIVVTFSGILLWLTLHSIVLHALGIPLFIRTAEERAAMRERILRLGKLRFSLIFGALGFGFAIGLIIAVMDLLEHGSDGWARAVFKLLACMSLSVWGYGVRVWNESYRGEVPFPPHFPPQK